MSLMNEAHRLKLASRSSSRFGRLSHNMFFSREAAHPRRLRFFPGLNGRPVQMVDDSEIELSSLSSNNSSSSRAASARSNLPMYAVNWANMSRVNNDTINTLQYFTGLRNFSVKEQRAQKQLSGLAPLMDTWKNELSAFVDDVFQSDANSVQTAPPAPKPSTPSQEAAQRQQLYSRKTGRLIESRAGRRSAIGSRTGRYTPAGRAVTADDLALVGTGAAAEDHDQAYIILQMLGQILQTDDPQAIGAWLASASDREKALALELIRAVVRARGDYLQPESRAVSRSACPPSASASAPAPQAGSSTEQQLFTIAEESAREGGSSPAPAAQKVINVLNVDAERRMLSGGKLYGYEGETPSALASATAPRPPERKAAGPRPSSRISTAARNGAATQRVAHGIDTWRPATSYADREDTDQTATNTTAD